jgi:hypothetical protein
MTLPPFPSWGGRTSAVSFSLPLPLSELTPLRCMTAPPAGAPPSSLVATVELDAGVSSFELVDWWDALDLERESQVDFMVRWDGVGRDEKGRRERDLEWEVVGSIWLRR